MAKHGTMQKAVLSALAVMMVASLVLAVAALAMPGLVMAKAAPEEHYCYWELQYYWGTCNQPCGFPAGTNLWKSYRHERRVCCDAYHCWYTGDQRDRFVGAWCTFCG